MGIRPLVGDISAWISSFYLRFTLGVDLSVYTLDLKLESLLYIQCSIFKIRQSVEKTVPSSCVLILLWPFPVPGEMGDSVTAIATRVL